MEALLESHTPQPTSLYLNVLRKTAEALDYAHSKGIVHRDIKPSNLMLCRDRRVKITDFGVAKVSDSPSLTQTGLVMGTPNYMSPEQARGQTVDGRSDQFSLAIVAYRMLAGFLPFDGSSLTAVLTQILLEQPKFTGTSLALQVQVVLKKGLAKDPAERYPSCSEFALALERACLESKAALARPAPPREVPSAGVRPAPAAPAWPSAGSSRPASPGETGSAIPIGLDLGGAENAAAAGDEEAAAVPDTGREISAAARMRPALIAAGSLAIVIVALVLMLWPRGARETAELSPPTGDPALTQPPAVPVDSTLPNPAPGSTDSSPLKQEDPPSGARPGTTPRAAQKPPRPAATQPAQKSTPAPVVASPAAPVKEAPGDPHPPPPVTASGVISWSGRMTRNSILVIDGPYVSFGTITGQFPAHPVAVDIEPPDLVVRERPREENGWKRLILHNPSRTISNISIRWKESGPDS
ncbi:MAG: hypothetical protein FJW35_01970 [Acidobacteria bacterium]|nr:hypothetical protein [Acidobacteriota bacterium]